MRRSGKGPAPTADLGRSHQKDQVLLAVRGALAAALAEVYLYAAVVVAAGIVISVFFARGPAPRSRGGYRAARDHRAGSNSSSSTASISAAVSAWTGGENQRCAIAVGTTADRITVVTSKENCSLSMIPAFRP